MEDKQIIISPEDFYRIKKVIDELDKGKLLSPISTSSEDHTYSYTVGKNAEGKYVISCNKLDMFGGLKLEE